MRRSILAFVLCVASSAVLVTPASAQELVNDLVVDFGPSRGLWIRLNNTTWQKLDNQSPVAVGSAVPCGDGMFASFTGRGLLARNATSGGWVVLRPDIVPSALAGGDVDGNRFCDVGALVTFPIPRLQVGLNGGEDGYWIRPWAPPEEPSGFAIGKTADADYIVGITLGGIYLGSSNRSLEQLFIEFPDYPYPGGRAVATGDLDDDGVDEIVFERNFQLDAIFVSNVPGSLNIDRRSSPVFTLGDLDANPIDDVLFTNGDGTFALFNNTRPSVKLDSRRASHLAIADLDQNGRGDAIASFGGQGVFVRFGEVSGFRLLRGWPVESLTPTAFD